MSRLLLMGASSAFILKMLRQIKAANLEMLLGNCSQALLRRFLFIFLTSAVACLDG
jgi:hypothetical protein